MFTLSSLSVPIVAAPMAGGPSTPELVAAVCGAGGLGFLAAGNRTAEATASQVAVARRLTARPFGVNLFVPESGPLAPAEEVVEFRETLAPLAARFGLDDLPQPWGDDDGWHAKLDLLVADPVPVVSFTFGLPPRVAVARLHAVGTAVWASVATVADAVAAVALGVDAVVCQGFEAGGHRATAACGDEPNELATLDLVRAVRAVVDLPLVAAGGIADAEGVRAALAAGADAVQCGTAFLRAPEAGTSAVHRAALASPDFTETVVTRAFTGRPARGLANAWTRTVADAPAAYPHVHRVTQPIRAAAGALGDAQYVHLWAGTGWRAASGLGAAEVVRSLADG